MFNEVSSFQGVLIRGVPAVLFIEMSSLQGGLIRGVLGLLPPPSLPLQGKRARRERRQIRERTQVRLPTPPTYAQRDSPTYEPYRPEHRYGNEVWEYECMDV